MVNINLYQPIDHSPFAWSIDETIDEKVAAAKCSSLWTPRGAEWDRFRWCRQAGRTTRFMVVNLVNYGGGLVVFDG